MSHLARVVQDSCLLPLPKDTPLAKARPAHRSWSSTAPSMLLPCWVNPQCLHTRVPHGRGGNTSLLCELGI